jgi:hypothetical protein
MRLQGMAVQTDINNIYGVTARMASASTA